MNKSFVRLFFVGLAIGMFASMMLSGCAPSWWSNPDHDIPLNSPSAQDGVGGGQDSITVSMPFSYGYAARCTQGPGGSYSHNYNSTRYDVDFDTPNNQDDDVFAPIAGQVWVHDNPSSGFGRHVNIDIGDGTYIVIAHMKQILLEDGEHVTVGQMIGLEGTTGASTGDHVHIGRHRGNALLDAGSGTSVEGLSFQFLGVTSPVASSQLVCGLTSGRVYTSELLTPKWHPNGTLVKTPQSSDVYVLEQGTAYPFLNEQSFWSRNYSFADLSFVSQDELACYNSGSWLTSTEQIRAVFDGTRVWMLFGADNDPVRYRKQVLTDGYMGVLESWGILVWSTNELPTDVQLGGVLARYPQTSGHVLFRDGSLLKESGRSDVYVVSDGIAMPIESWDTMLILDFATRDIVEVDPGVVARVQGRVGNCVTDNACVSFNDVFTCGGEEETPPLEPEDTGTNDTNSQDTDSGDTGLPWESDTGDTSTNDTADTFPPEDTCEQSDVLSLAWMTPGGVPADRVALSGAYTSANGFSLGWQRDMVRACNDNAVLYERYDAMPGDKLRFSVEYENVNTTGWSCEGSLPGVRRGTVYAMFGGVPISVATVADPTSSGCNLEITVP